MKGKMPRHPMKPLRLLPSVRCWIPKNMLAPDTVMATYFVTAFSPWMRAVITLGIEIAIRPFNIVVSTFVGFMGPASESESERVEFKRERV